MRIRGRTARAATSRPPTGGCGSSSPPRSRSWRPSGPPSGRRSRRLRLTPIMFELGSRAHPPRQLYRAYLEQSDVFVGIYGERYGWIAPDMPISGLEDEFELSSGKPRLVYVRRTAPDREPRLDDLIVRIQAESGSSTVPFDGPGELAERVADDLAVLLTERFAASPAPPVPGLAPGWLPTPATPMVDRRDALALVTGLLRDPAVRLVTVSGPGGIGKTRLALAAAQELAAERDAVWLVDLESVRDPADVPGAIAAAVGVAVEGRRPVLDLVADRLAGSHVLLLLDNVEQVLGAAPELARLLAHCPRTQLLVTSRSLLRLRGEHDVPLGPLARPVRRPALRRPGPGGRPGVRARRGHRGRRGRGRPAPRGAAAGRGARRGPGPHDAATAPAAPPRRGARPPRAVRRPPRPAADAPRHRGVEPRPAPGPRAGAAGPPVGVRGRRHPRQGGGRGRGRRRPRRPGGPVLAGRATAW